MAWAAGQTFDPGRQLDGSIASISDIRLETKNRRIAAWWTFSLVPDMAGGRWQLAVRRTVSRLPSRQAFTGPPSLLTAFRCGRISSAWRTDAQATCLAYSFTM
jgi:hypothetical protein